MTRLTAAQYNAGAAKKPAKGRSRVMGTVAKEVDGIKFHSTKEARRYVVLRDLQAAGRICNLEMQVPYVLMGKDGPLKTPTGRDMRYILDFRYVDWDRDGRTILEDVKGWQTDVSKIKLAIMAAQGDPVELT